MADESTTLTTSPPLSSSSSSNRAESLHLLASGIAAGDVWADAEAKPGSLPVRTTGYSFEEWQLDDYA